jgi:hypothetical protein
MKVLIRFIGINISVFESGINLVRLVHRIFHQRIGLLKNDHHHRYCVCLRKSGSRLNS